VAQFLDLALQRLHLRLQRLDLVDEIDRTALRGTALLLLEARDALGQRQPILRTNRRDENGNVPLRTRCGT
jgi:hypothetical protein